jgi:hypothetical protein
MPEAENVWAPDVEHRTHPFGEKGVVSSLEETANRVAKGSLSPRVRLWAIECLDRARVEEGLRADNDKERAQILLRAVQKKLWVPDPVGAEWMAGSHLMACDPSKDGVCFRGGDCDDLVILLGACLCAVGIYTMVVGHAYDRQRTISHVLCAARVNGRWMYADPSTKLPLGECVRFTRERIYSVPNVRMLCDENACLTNPRKYDPDKAGFISKGEFVGVDGVPTFAWLAEPDRTVEWLGATEDPYEAGANAIVDSAGKRGGGLSKDDVGAYGEAGGAAAATAACAASGAGVAVSTLCGAVGGKVGRFIAEAFYDIFGGEDTEAIRREQAKAWDAYQVVADKILNAKQAAHRALQAAFDGINVAYKEAVSGQPLADRDPSVGVWPLSEEETRQIASAMQQKGLALFVGKRYQNSLRIVWPPFWSAPCQGGLGFEGTTSADCVVAKQWHAEGEATLKDIQAWLAKLDNVATDIALDIALQAAVNEATGQKNPIQLIKQEPAKSLTFKAFPFFFTQPTKKKSSALPVVAGLAAAGGLAWWLLLA